MTIITYVWGMDQQGRKCACKGIRSCLVCEGPELTGGGGGLGAAAAISSFKEDPFTNATTTTLYQCHHCGKILREDETMPELGEAKPLLSCRSGRCGPEMKIIRIRGGEASDVCPRRGAAMPDGVTVVKEFISREEEREIVAEIDRSQWAESQSGRRKQVYRTFKG
jgi:hypothetical protein